MHKMDEKENPYLILNEWLGQHLLQNSLLLLGEVQTECPQRHFYSSFQN